MIKTLKHMRLGHNRLSVHNGSWKNKASKNELDVRTTTDVKDKCLKQTTPKNSLENKNIDVLFGVWKKIVNIEEFGIYVFIKAVNIYMLLLMCLRCEK